MRPCEPLCRLPEKGGRSNVLERMRHNQLVHVPALSSAHGHRAAHDLCPITTRVCHNPHRRMGVQVTRVCSGIVRSTCSGVHMHAALNCWLMLAPSAQLGWELTEVPLSQVPAEEHRACQHLTDGHQHIC